MDSFHRERRKADGDIFCAAFVRSGVTDPFTGVGYYGLTGSNVKRSAFVFHSESSFQDDSEFFERGRLARLTPSGGTAHVGYARGGRMGIDAADVFVDELGLVAGGQDASGLRD